MSRMKKIIILGGGLLFNLTRAARNRAGSDDSAGSGSNCSIQSSGIPLSLRHAPAQCTTGELSPPQGVKRTLPTVGPTHQPLRRAVESGSDPYVQGPLSGPEMYPRVILQVVTQGATQGARVQFGDPYPPTYTQRALGPIVHPQPSQELQSLSTEQGTAEARVTLSNVCSLDVGPRLQSPQVYCMNTGSTPSDSATSIASVPSTPSIRCPIQCLRRQQVDPQPEAGAKT